ncbi:MAG: ABC transporter permease subunit [Phycisphaeraceae bacterium]|nr:ABC transporter permease subunit [Phycisphaeraceae bacterium]
MSAFYEWLYYLVPANPLLVRIVQGASRRRGHLFVRMGYLGTLIAVVLFGLLTAGSLSGTQSLTALAKAGGQIFSIISYAQILLICLIAPVFMAGAIAAEQSGKTYNILLTTPLSNLQIVLGSLLGRLYFVLALLASGLPLFAVLLIFGGVPIRAVFVSFGIAGFSALMVGSVAITLAVLRAGGRKAVFLFVISIIGYLLVCYAIDAYILRGRWTVGVDGITVLTPLHPMLVLEATLGAARYRVPPPELIAHHSAWIRFYLGYPFAAFACLTSLASFVLVLWSALRIRQLGQGEPGWFRRSVMGRWLRLETGGERRRKPRDVWANPIAWREASTRGNRAAALLGRWGFIVIGLGAAAGAIILRHKGMLTDYDFRTTILTLLLTELVVILLIAIYMSAGSVSREREDGTLDLLLTTPITPRLYLWGKLRGLISFLAMLLSVPVLTVTMLAIYTFIGQRLHWQQVEVTRYRNTIQVRGSLMFPEAPLLLAMVIVPAIATCVVWGMRCSITSKGVLGAVTKSVGLIGALMAVGGFCGWTAADSIPVVGALMNALSPTTGLVMVVDPWSLASFIDNPGVGRISLLFAGLIAVAVHSIVVYSLLTTMVGTFDKSVRELAGAA